MLRERTFRDKKSILEVLFDFTNETWIVLFNIVLCVGVFYLNVAEDNKVNMKVLSNV